MCKPYPGPRCSSHAGEALDKAKGKFESAQKAYDAAPSLDNANARWAAYGKVETAQLEFNATKKGIKALRDAGKESDAVHFERVRKGQLDALKAKEAKDVTATPSADKSYVSNASGGKKSPREYASDPNISYKMMNKLVGFKSAHMALATNPSTPEDILHQIAHSEGAAENRELLTAVANHKNCPQWLAYKMGVTPGAPAPQVSTPSAARSLATAPVSVAPPASPSATVNGGSSATSAKRSLSERAADPNTSYNMMAKLVGFESAHVALASNPSAPQDILHQIAHLESSKKNPELLQAISSNKNCPQWLADKILSPSF